MPIPNPPNEEARLATLANYDLLDTPPQPEFEHLTAMAARFFNVPIAVVALVDAERVWYESCHGLHMTETPRAMAFCACTILGTVPFIVPDAAADERFADGELVAGPARVRFYVGVPLITLAGVPLGSLCLMDTAPRAFSEAEAASLTQMGNVVMAAIEAHHTEQRLRREIAVHEQTTQSLREVEARYRRTAENTPGMVYQLVIRADGSAEFPFVSDACRAILELEPATLQRDASEYMRLIHPKDKAGRDRLIAEALRTLQPLRWEGRFILPSGKIKWVQISSQPERMPNGDMCWDGLLLDITERKQVENRLLMLSSSVEHANDVILVTSAEPVDEPGPRIIYVNKAFTINTGYTAEEAIGKTPRILQGPDTSAEARATIRRALKAWEPVRVELLNYRKDGSEFWVELNIVPVANERGWWTHWVSVQRDITERKQVEQALTQAALTTGQAREEAERANRAKSEFLSRMSHELRTPLNAILGFGQLLEMDKPTDRQREKLSHILKGGQHLLGLINEVLDISRIESGQIELTLEAVNVEKVFNEASDLIQPLAAQRGIHVGRCLGRASKGFLLADRQRLVQVVLNLLSNAVKYNRSGGTVGISCEPAARAGSLRLAVTDTGPGIAPADLAKLFTPFERLAAEHSNIEGSGIGLAISKRLVEAMGGTVGVESTPGHGSTFYLELPAAVIKETAQPAALAPEPLPSDGPVILCIEDNLSNYSLVELALEAKRPDVRLVGAMLGRLGLEMAREQRPDLILLDLQLPDIPGDELLQRLQEDERTRDIPVIMVTADATNGQSRRLLKLGAHAYLTKPLNIPMFLRTIEDALGEDTPAHQLVEVA